ncbi:hypothetical protein [Streptomyces sp. NPDC002690]
MTRSDDAAAATLRVPARKGGGPGGTGPGPAASSFGAVRTGVRPDPYTSRATLVRRGAGRPGVPVRTEESDATGKDTLARASG